MLVLLVYDWSIVILALPVERIERPLNVAPVSQVDMVKSEADCSVMLDVPELRVTVPAAIKLPMPFES